MDTQRFREFDLGVNARVDEIIDETKDMAPSFLSTGLFDVKQSDSMTYRTKGVTGLGYLEKKDENGKYKEDVTTPQYKTEYNMQEFGKIVSISQLLAKTRSSELDEKLDEVRQSIIAANRSIERNAWRILVDAFVTTDSDSNVPTFRLDDGLSFISTAHTSRVSGVANRSNRVSGNPVLTETSLFSAERIIAEQLNGRGLPINYQGDYILVVPTALKKKAFEITKSELRSATTDNDVNYFTGGKMDFVSSTYIGAANGGSDTAFFVVAKNASVKPMKYVTLIEPKVEKDTDFGSKAIKVSIDAAWAFGYSNFEYICGSDGTAS